MPYIEESGGLILGRPKILSITSTAFLLSNLSPLTQEERRLNGDCPLPLVRFR